MAFLEKIHLEIMYRIKNIVLELIVYKIHYNNLRFIDPILLINL